MNYNILEKNSGSVITRKQKKEDNIIVITIVTVFDVSHEENYRVGIQVFKELLQGRNTGIHRDMTG